MTRRLVRTAGAVLVLVPFVPLEWLYRGALTPPVHVAPSAWLLGLFVFGAGAWVLGRVAPPLSDWLLGGAGLLDRALTGRRHTVAWTAALTVLLLVTGRVVFQHRPLLVDSVVQLFQAKIFAAGMLTAPAPPDEAFVATQHMLVRHGRWFAQYPPGHAALLALGWLVGVPWLVPVLLTLGTALLLKRFATAAWDERTGRATLMLAVFAPFFWVMGASFMNHVTCLFFAAAFLVAYQRWEAGGGAPWALAAGLAIGAAGLARPLTALAVAAVFAPLGLRDAWRRRRFGSIAAAGTGGLAAVAVYMAFNSATTGEPLVPGYLELWGASHGLGFHVSPWGQAHTFWTGLRNEITDLSLLGEFFLEWPIPALLPAGLYLVLTGGRNDWDRRMTAGLLALPAVYLFYWHRDAYLGPRFLYTGLLFLLPLTARALLALPELPSGRLRLKETAVVAAALCFAYTGLYAAPRRAAGYASSLASMKPDLPVEMREAGIEHGIVFVAVSWGNRLLARMRGAGVPASTAERVYRRADHCAIELRLRAAAAEGWTGERLAAELDALPREGRTLREASPNLDPTLRLVPDRPLDPACRAELSHDAAGYANWLPFLLENDPGLAAPLLYVRDLRDLDARLLAARPGRPAWLYRPSGLVPVEPSAPTP